MEHWTELRTALTLARLGTVSAAAEVLGVHRATVNRHVETLESAFGGPLFHRHARGYALSDAGRDMLEVAARADEMFTDLAGRARGRAGGLSGALKITALAGVAPLLMPAIAAFHREHPKIALEFVAGAQLARLEYGEAHVAIRAGARPEVPDYVVSLFRRLRFGLYGSRAYLERAGVPDRWPLTDHAYVGAVPETRPLPFVDWVASNVQPTGIALMSRDPQVVLTAVERGMGLGILSEHDAAARPDLVAVIAPSDAWSAALWTVTHVDLHRTAKVQAFLKYLKKA